MEASYKIKNKTHSKQSYTNKMQPIIICFFLLTVAQAAATITYSSIFTATLATSSVTLANAQTKEGIKTGFCTGGRASCAIFSGGEYCPSPYCPTGRGNTCGPAENYDFIWRVVNGEFPLSSLLDNTEEIEDENEDVFPIEKLERIYILLMGTNNLGGGMLPEPTIKGMDAAGRKILQLHEKHFPNTLAALLFSELLPRKDDFRAVKMCPPRCKNVEKLEPYQSFMPAIKKVNRALPNMLDGWRQDFQNSRIILLSANTETSEVGEIEIHDNTRHVYTPVITCGKEMFSFNDLNEFDVYMPDRLHPNAKGYQLWSRCLKRGLDAIMTR